jgi:immunity protein 51 of polymorphic toxin system
MCQHSPVRPLKLIEAKPGNFSLILNAGTTKVDAMVGELGHEPSGYFWAGVAEALVSTENPALGPRLAYDCEADMFCAYGQDRAALEELGARMAAVATDADRLRRLLAVAAERGISLDD